MQLRGTARGVAVYDDFAHHPTAIAETLAGVRSAYPDRRIWAIFEPRSATSCRKIFQEEFARAFAAADRVLLPAIFRSTLPEDQRLSTERLVADLEGGRQGRALHPEVDDIVAAVAKEARDGDLVVVMSNGGFDDIHQKLLTALEARRRSLRMDVPRSCAAGDAAWLIELPERIDAAVNARAIHIARAVEAAGLPVTDVVVGYRSVMVYVDPLADAAGDGRGARCARSRRRRRGGDAAPGALVEVPVCYDGPYGPDLARRRGVRRSARSTR